METCGRTTGMGMVLAPSHRSANPPLLKKSLTDYFDERSVGPLNEDGINPQEGWFEGLFYAPSTEFTLARHEIACLDRQLVTARDQWKIDKVVIDKRWDKAMYTQNKIYNEIPILNDYYKETFEKRNRATRNLGVEQDQIVIKNREIRRCRKEVTKLLEVKGEVQGRLDKFWLFKTYLGRVKDSSRGEYQVVKDLIDRYGVLANARDGLMARNEGFRDTVARRQKALEDDILMKSNEVLAYRNYLSELLEYDTNLQEEVFRLQDNLVRIKTTAASRTLVIGQIKMAINNLYLQVCKSMHRTPKIMPEDTLGQLLDVRISIREMSKLSRDIRRMLKAAHLTAKAEALAREKLRKLNEERQKRMDRLAKKGAVDIRDLFNLPPVKAKTPDISKLLLIPPSN